MTNAELIAALRWCPSHSCGRCVALDANGRCTLYGVVGLMHSAADLIEAQAKRIKELEESNKMLKNTIGADKGVMLDRIRFLEAQLPKNGEWMKSIRWYYQQPTRTAATTDGTTFMCRSTGKPCPNATEYGYCKQTACTNCG